MDADTEVGGLPLQNLTDDGIDVVFELMAELDQPEAEEAPTAMTGKQFANLLYTRKGKVFLSTPDWCVEVKKIDLWNTYNGKDVSVPFKVLNPEAETGDFTLTPV